VAIELNETNGQLGKIKDYNVFEAEPVLTRRKGQKKYNAAILVD